MMLHARPNEMSVERKPAAFADLRGWIAALEAQDELANINAEVDWNIELGTIMRLAQGPGTGKALLFNNIKDYNKPTSRCRRTALGAPSRHRPKAAPRRAGLAVAAVQASRCRRPRPP